MRASSYSIAIALFLAVCLSTASADPATERGAKIARDAKQRDLGFGDYAVLLTMTLKSADGRESMRKLRARNLEVAGDGDKTLLIFDEPKDLDGTALLTYAHRGRDDDRWLYVPSIKRVKRITSNNQSGPFMGSEFTYEDLGSVEVENYTYRFVREGTVGTEKTFVFERYPVHKNSGYGRQVVTLDQSAYRVLTIEFFDLKNAPLKTFTASGYRKYANKYWKAARFVMVNQQTGKSTTLDFQGYKFGNGFNPDDFDPKSLESVQ